MSRVRWITTHERRGSQVVRQWKIIRTIASSRYLTTRDLVEQFGVCKKTIYRDLTILCAAGFPIYRARTPGSTVESEQGYIRIADDWLLRAPRRIPKVMHLAIDDGILRIPEMVVTR